MQYYKPQQLIVVGDLFPGVANKELDFFRKWRNDFSNLHVQLVKGNHDILRKEWYFRQILLLHPCIGLAKQTLSLPCYYFSDSFLVLPAFSKFTGGASIKPTSPDSVFAIIPAELTKQYGD